MKRKLWFSIALTIVMAIMLAAPAFASDVKLDENSTVAKAIKRGTLIVGMDVFVPWAMKDKKGQLVGFEIDVAKQLAKDMGIEIEFVPTKWDGIIAALLTSKFDVIIGGMSISEERKKKVDFSDPYEYSGQSIVANKKKAPGLTTLDDFNKPEIEIAVKLGTTAEATAKRMIPNATLRRFQDEAQAYQELRNGNVAAVVSSAPKPEFEAAEYPETLYLPLDSTFTKEPIGFAMRKNDPSTLAYFNAWIAKKWADGFLKERYNYWFRSKAWEPMVK